MRLLLLIITFIICYMIDEKPVNSLSTREVTTINRTDTISINIDDIVNTLRFYTK